MSVLVVPERSVSQRMEALAAANRKRVYRARTIKAGLRARTVGLFDALDDPQCDTMRVRDVLLAVPRLGASKVDRAMRDADISASKTCAGITASQRMRLARVLAERHPHTVILYRA